MARDNNRAYLTIVSTILSKLTCTDVGLDAVKLTTQALALSDRRWLTQHPIAFTLSSQNIASRRSAARCFAPIWFDTYMELFRRVVKKTLEAIPGVTKVRFAHSKGRYMDVSVEVDYMQPYINGMLTGDYPENAVTVLPQLRMAPGGGYYFNNPTMQTLFKGAQYAYTFRIHYGTYVPNLGYNYAHGLSDFIEQILSTMDLHRSILARPQFNIVNIYEDYNVRGGNVNA